MTLHNLEKRRQVWGRRQTHSLKENQKKLLASLMPQVEILLSQTPIGGKLDLQALFPESQEIWLEIGFGGGEHLAAQAKTHPTVGIIGCEPFLNGVASLLGHLDAENLHNVRIVQDDARLCIEQIPPHSLSRIFILFADPWPKKRHHKRRIIQAEFLEQLAQRLKPKGCLYIATDDPGYQEWVQDILASSSVFSVVDDGRVSLSVRPNKPDEWATTRYEQKAIAAGRTPMYWICLKND